MLNVLAVVGVVSGERWMATVVDDGVADAASISRAARSKGKEPET